MPTPLTWLLNPIPLLSKCHHSAPQGHFRPAPSRRNRSSTSVLTNENLGTASELPPYAIFSFPLPTGLWITFRTGGTNGLIPSSSIHYLRNRVSFFRHFGSSLHL
jgi:hypothetical protein